MGKNSFDEITGKGNEQVAKMLEETFPGYTKDVYENAAERAFAINGLTLMFASLGGKKDE